MNLATVSAINALTAVTELLSGGKLTLYNGTQPTTPETALSGNTPLATFTFANPSYGSSNLVSSNEQQAISFASSSVTPGANGTVTFARATMLTAAWGTSTSYSTGAIVTANSNLWLCVKSGMSLNSGTGPTSNPQYFTDNPTQIGGSVVQWQFLGASTQTTVADFTVSTSGADIIIGNTTLSTTINVTITSFILQIPAV